MKKTTEYEQAEQRAHHSPSHKEMQVGVRDLIQKLFQFSTRLERLSRARRTNVDDSMDQNGCLAPDEPTLMTLGGKRHKTGRVSLDYFCIMMNFSVRILCLNYCSDNCKDAVTGRRFPANCLPCHVCPLVNELINQSLSMPVGQSDSQPINQAVGQPVGRSVKFCFKCLLLKEFQTKSDRNSSILSF